MEARGNRAALDGIKSIILEHGDSAVKLGNGTFIQSLPGGPLRFMHSVFTGCSEGEIRELQRVSAIPLPVDYIEFMRWAGGAKLFDNTLFIYGLRDNQKRGLALEDQAPLSLAAELDLLRQRGKWDVAAEWQPAGSIAAATQTFSLDLLDGGRARLRRDDGAAREFPSFADCLLSLIILFSNASDEGGLRDDTGAEVQEDLMALFTRH